MCQEIYLQKRKLILLTVEKFCKKSPQKLIKKTPPIFVKMSVTQISAGDAFALLKKDENSVLVDVRTAEEFNFVGIANASSFNDRLLLLPWQTLPRMDENPQFASVLEDSLQEILGADFKNAQIIFICRSGARSNFAAHYAQNIGFKNCYNLISGFEGDLNEKKQRGTLNGWKANNLPWSQK
jgi:rhodanese-related sulfurtransferase